jgi:hypothetical protein
MERLKGAVDGGDAQNGHAIAESRRHKELVARVDKHVVARVAHQRETHADRHFLAGTAKACAVQIGQRRGLAGGVALRALQTTGRTQQLGQAHARRDGLGALLADGPDHGGVVTRPGRDQHVGPHEAILLLEHALDGALGLVRRETRDWDTSDAGHVDFALTVDDEAGVLGHFIADGAHGHHVARQNCEWGRGIVVHAGRHDIAAGKRGVFVGIRGRLGEAGPAADHGAGKHKRGKQRGGCSYRTSHGLPRAKLDGEVAYFCAHRPPRSV